MKVVTFSAGPTLNCHWIFVVGSFCGYIQLDSAAVAVVRCTGRLYVGGVERNRSGETEERELTDCTD